MGQQIERCEQAIEHALDQVTNQVTESLSEIAALTRTLHNAHAEQELEFRSLIEQHNHVQATAAERVKLERRRNELMERQREKTRLTIGLLRELGSCFQGGRYLPISAEELAKVLGVPDVNTIPGCIRGLRRNIVSRLRKYLNMDVGPNEVICRDEQGYYLLPWITVREGDDAGEVDNVHSGCAAVSATAVTCVPANVPSSELNERQQWALRQLDIGVKLQRVMLEHKFNVAEKTAKRDLADLSRRNTIEFIRSGREGHYRLIAAEDLTCHGT